jgi:hypothetical protein
MPGSPPVRGVEDLGDGEPTHAAREVGQPGELVTIL